MRRRLTLAFLFVVAACGSNDTAAPPNSGNGDTVALDTVTSETVASDTTAPDTDVADPLTAAGLPFQVNADGTFSLGPFTTRPATDARLSPLASRDGTETVLFALGFYGFKDTGGAWTPLRVDAPTATVTALGPGLARLKLTAPEGHDRVSATFACAPDDHFLGFGGQTDQLDHRGERVPIWVEEEGLGKSDATLEEDPSPIAHRHAAYYPVPSFLSPNGKAVLVGGTERVIFELCTPEHPDAWRVEIWSRTLELTFVVGSTPLETLERLVSVLGKPPLPPDWALFPWIAIKGGAQVVTELVAKLSGSTAKVPMGAIWSEDWLGASINPFSGFNIKYHWEWDPAYYPDLPKLIANFHKDDLRFMGYFNPFVTVEFKEWTEALAGGFLPTTPEGKPYEFPILLKTGSVVDVTNPKAVDWLVGYMDRARKEIGLDGWMADYGEWVPYDARFHDGRTGAAVSSDYPRLWQDANRRACKAEDGCLYFVRSGYTGSSAKAAAVWGGDQQTTFGEDDGLPTAVRMGIGLGLAGVAFYGSDIAGYSSFGVPTATKELWFRWATFGAFSPIMRTHEGNKGPENWQLDRDAETTAHFTRWADWHVRLWPLWKALLVDAAATGRPLMRHPALHYPSMTTVRDTYLLGDVLYVAPVVAEGATSRVVPMPPGRWVDLFTGAPVAGGKDVTVAAPVTELPVFLRAGGIVPLLPTGLTRPAQAATAFGKGLTLRMALGANGAFTLHDGTAITLTSAATTDPGDLGMPACTGDVRPCTTRTGKVRLVRLSGRSLEAPGLTVKITGGPERGYDIELLAD